jgi:putative spermidine/putrescine transport system ATP-binding protein
MPEALKLVGITKRYGDAVAVRKLDLAAEAGQVTVLLGPSGCGKTTTLRVIAGLLGPDEGKVWIDGELANDPGVVLPPGKRRIGMVFQSLALWPHMTVEGNLRFVIDRQGRDERIDRALEMVDLSGRKTSYPAELSGGEQQRVALARALVTEPKMLLLDEPLANLDDTLRRRLLESMRELRRKLGITTVFVTHSQEEALAFADRIAVLRSGRILQADAPEEIYSRPKTRFVAEFLGASNILGTREGSDGCLETVLGPFRPSERPEGPVCGMLRPEDMAVVPASEGTGGKVESCRYRGSHYEVGVRVADASLRIRSRDRADPGEAVGVKWLREPVLLVDDSEGESQ